MLVLFLLLFLLLSQRAKFNSVHSQSPQFLVAKRNEACETLGMLLRPGDLLRQAAVSFSVELQSSLFTNFSNPILLALDKRRYCNNDAETTRGVVFQAATGC